MNTSIEFKDNTVLVSLDGRLDTVSAVQCEKDFLPLRENADKEILMDCRNLEYISSSGLRLFLALRKDVQSKGGKLVIEHICEDIRNVFTITGFFKLFDIRP